MDRPVAPPLVPTWGLARPLGAAAERRQQLLSLSRQLGSGVWEHRLSSPSDVIVWAAARGSILFFPFKTWPAAGLIGSTHLSIGAPCSSAGCCQALPSAVPTPSFIAPSWSLGLGCSRGSGPATATRQPLPSPGLGLPGGLGLCGVYVPTVET